MIETIKLASITLVITMVAKAGGRRNDSHYIALAGLCQALQPLLGSMFSLLTKMSITIESISQWKIIEILTNLFM